MHLIVLSFSCLRGVHVLREALVLGVTGFSGMGMWNDGMKFSLFACLSTMA